MTSRNKGILSSDFLVPLIGLLVAFLLVEPFYAFVVRPKADVIAIKQKVLTAQGAASGKNSEMRSLYVIIKDPEQEWEIIFAVWGFIILTHKLMQIRGE